MTGPRQGGHGPDFWSERRPERQLLLLAVGGVALGFVLVLGAGIAAGRPLTIMDWVPFVSYALCLLVVHLTLVAAQFRGDQILLATLAFLAGLGLLIQFRMGTYDPAQGSSLGRYLFPGGIGVLLATCLMFMRGRYENLAAGIWVWGGLSLLLIGVVVVTGQRYRGAVYATGLVTPTEFLKVTITLFLAGFIDRHGKTLGNWGNSWLPLPPWQGLLPLMLYWAVLAGLLAWQRDVGLFIILSVTLLVMLYLGTGRLGYLVVGILGAVGLGYGVLSLMPHGQRRIQAWLDPFSDPTGGSWQILQGLSGMYAGGLWGEGFGLGNPQYTPIAESDFIYSVIGEELGLVGCALVLILFLVLFQRGLGISFQARSKFGVLVSGGLTTLIAVQTFLNLGGVTKFIPLTGLTLPFLSHGGSSLITGFVSLGLILAVSDGMPAGRTTGGRPGPTRTSTQDSKRASRKPQLVGESPEP